MTDISGYELALAQLRNPSQWCQAAQRLRDLTPVGALAETRTLLALLHAYESPEEANRQCLLQALSDLGAKPGADRLFAEAQTLDDSELMRGTLHLMEMFPDAAHLPALESAILHPNRVIYRAAQRALAAQYQTPDWEALLLRILSAESTTARSAGIALLGTRAAQSRLVADALRARLVLETDELLYAQIEAVLNNACLK